MKNMANLVELILHTVTTTVAGFARVSYSIHQHDYFLTQTER